MDSKDKRLAEFVGILLGDGSLCLTDGRNTNNRLKITLNKIDDAEYMDYVKCLMLELFELEPKIHLRKNENATDLFLFNKRIILYLTNEIGLKLSPKWQRAIIPYKFLSEELGKYVLRGYFDTDGCIVTTNNNGTIHPRLEMKVSPSPMQQQFVNLLKMYQFKFGVYQIGKGKVRIQLNGKQELRKWAELIGFSNMKNVRKAEKFLQQTLNSVKQNFLSRRGRITW